MKTIVSVDCEVDGLVPGLSSLLQIGAAAYNMEGKLLARFSINLQPLPGAKPEKTTMEFWAYQPDEIWKAVIQNQQPPKGAMIRFANFLAQFRRPRMLMAPVLFDGNWIRYYLERFVGHSDLWHNDLDLRSIVWSWTGKYEGDYQVLIEKLTGYEAMERNHLALGDAIEQANCFFALVRWAEKEGLRKVV